MSKVRIGYLRVMIVDDSRVQRKSMHDMLQKAGFKHMDEAENATQAYEKMDALKYDVVYLDWMMPGRSGISLMEEWRADRRYDDVAIVVCSMQEDKRMIAGALRAGALNYILKPVTEEKLHRSLEEVIEWLDLRRKAREEQAN